jgi:transcriptional regulator with XRE-family HTH domain
MTNQRLSNSFRDPLLDETLRCLAESGTAYIAHKSGLSKSTITNWRSGKTKRPQAASLSVALRAAGFKLTIVKG